MLEFGMEPIREDPFFDGSDHTTDDESSFTSDESSEVIPSETSEDRDFIVSDTDQLSRLSSSLPESFVSQNSFETHSQLEMDEMNEFGRKVPVKAIFRRVITQGGKKTVRYLVLWYSWEENNPIGSD